uniref:Protein transporter SEC61 subunit alpha n=1 Tax=Metchnikovella dogieli TaxID=2804710 RepID=A0A896WNB7_9MICR|nr:protein transporter SEC61 subunit alpha [Metchnikovella dogieli]
MTFRALNIVRPFMGLLPTIRKPARRVGFGEKLLWTSVTLFVFLVCSHIPLFGIMSSETSDPFYWMRAILASNRGTLMELGTSPIISAGMIMQVLSNSGLLVVDTAIKEDQLLFAGAEKLLALVMTFGQAVVQVMTGFYGAPGSIGAGMCLMLVLQLFVAGLIIVMLDEVLESGYGLGSGVSLFIATNVCENIFWKAFSPTTHVTGKGTEFEGAVVGLVHVLFVRKNKFLALREAFCRTNFANMSSLLATVAVFLGIAYLQGVRLELPLIGNGNTRQQGKYGIKLFYTSNMPIMLLTTIMSHIFFISQMLYRRFPENMFVRLLGVWEPRKGGGMYAERGFAHYMMAPESLRDLFFSPLKTLAYLCFFLGLSFFLSRMWIEVSGTAPKDVARRLKAQGMTLRGHRDGSLQKELERIIPIAAGLGGVVIAFVCVCADLLGAVGSGTGILMTVTIIYQYFEIFAKELAEFGGYKTIAFK